MLSYTDSRADDTVLSSATDSDLITISRDAGRLANQAEARQVLAAYQLGVIRHRQMLELPMVTRFRNGGQKATVAKVSQQLGIPAHRAMMWIATGRRLDVLPQVRHAYLEGRFDTLRVRVIAEELAPLPDALRAELEPIALELADRPTTDQRLRHQLERLIITRAPDHATAAREEFSRNHSNVSVRDEAHGHSTVDATIPAEQGVWIRNQYETLVRKRVCSNDPRTPGQRRAAAFAEISG